MIDNESNVSLQIIIPENEYTEEDAIAMLEGLPDEEDLPNYLNRHRHFINEQIKHIRENTRIENEQYDEDIHSSSSSSCRTVLPFRI